MVTLTHCTTAQAAEQLGINHFTLEAMILRGRISPPAKGPGGQYRWTSDDIEHARRVRQEMRRRRARRNHAALA